MNCPFCNDKMIWINDVDLEDVSLDQEKGIISLYICSNDECGCAADFTLKEKE